MKSIAVTWRTIAFNTLLINVYKELKNDSTSKIAQMGIEKSDAQQPTYVPWEATLTAVWRSFIEKGNTTQYR